MVFDVLFNGAASQFCLAVGIGLVWYALTKKPDLLGRIAHVREYASRKKRVAKANVEIERGRAERSSLQKVLERTRQLVRDRIDIGDPHQLRITAIGFAVVTLVLYQGDNFLMTLLNGGSSLFGLTVRAWAVGSPWIVLSIFVGIHMLISMAIVDSDRPTRTLRLARIGALITGVLVLTSMWGSLAGRGLDFSTGGWAADAIQWSLWLLVLVLALCGGFTAVMASEHFRQAGLAARLVDLETLDDEYKRHIEALESEVSMHDDKSECTVGEPTSPHGVVRAVEHAAGLLIAVMTASLLAGSGTVAAASDGTAAPPAGAAPASGRSNVVAVAGDLPIGTLLSPPAWVMHAAQPADNECDALLDVSRSISPNDKIAAIQAFAEMLPNILEAFNCSVIRISAFSADAPFQPIREFVLPTLPAASSCTTNRQASGGIAGLAQQMYPDLKAAERQRNDDACQQKQRDEAAAAAGPRVSAVKEASASATGLMEVQPRGSCTALYQAAARALQRSQHVVAVTDGAQTCHWYRT